MANMFYNGPTNVNPALQNLAETIKFAKTFSSPQAYLAELKKQNPAGYQMLENLSKQLQNPLQSGINMLNEQGINPQQLQMLLNN